MAISLDLAKLNPLLDQMAALRHRKSRFPAAFGLVLAALAVAAAAEFLLGSATGVLFALAVVASTALFGLTAGLLSALSAGSLLNFRYLPLFHAGVDAPVGRLTLVLVLLAAGTHLVGRVVLARVRSRYKPPLGIHGTFDGLGEDGELYGWAFDADHPSVPVQLTVFADGRPAAQAVAVYYRPDVASAMNCSGSHGFHVGLASSPPATASSKTLIDVRLPNGTPLDGSPKQMRIPVRSAPERPTVLFLHIPKTAGIAFRDSIVPNFRQSEVAYLYPTAPGFLVTDLRSLPLEQLRGFRFVVGHFQFGMHEALPQASEYITIVREPIARALSHYAFLQQTQPQLVTDSEGCLLPLEQLLEQQLSVDFDNPLVRIFAGVDQQEFPPGRLTPDAYDQAVYNLHTAFRFVGHQEESGRAYARLQKQYGWGAIPRLPLVNVGQRQRTAPISEHTAAAIRHFNTLDVALHAEILRYFPI